MTVGILQTGSTPASLEPRFGRYDAMMTRMLGQGFSTRTYDIQAGDYPVSIEDHDGYLITGSSAGVYDPLPWIEPLKAFLRQARGRARVVGICFGHQIMAEAYGGRVEQSHKGWGLGLHTYDLEGEAEWMNGGRRVSVAASHQDQVVEVPAGGVVLGGSAFTPHGILAYSDAHAISFQFHPEFVPAFSEALVELRRAQLSHRDAEAAIASLRGPHDAARVGGWIRRFLTDYS